jgi:hypothetical protein
VTSFAQTPPGQFTRFWRNFFNAKGSYPSLQLAQAQGNYIYGLGVATLVGSTGVNGAIVGIGMVGQVTDGLNQAMAGVGIAPKEPPRILSVERTAQGVRVVFDDPLNVPNGDYLYQLIHFENANAKPRLAGTATPEDFVDTTKWFVLDSTPPQSGVSFYVMTTTSRIDGRSVYGESHVLTPWWSIPLSGSNVAYFAWLSGNKVGYTSDYSAPMTYAAGPAPNLGNVDAIAVSPLTQSVFVSRPLTKQITKMTNFGEVLGEEDAFISIPYKSPGQKGLAVDSNGYLFTDNSASDSQFGGRLFKFNGFDGSMTFTGTVNYFSQLLMYANPVMVGPMVLGPDGQLYVYEAMSRSVKAVPVNAAWEAGRRVGLPFFTLDTSDVGNVIDMEFRNDALQSNSLFILEGQDIIRVFSDAISETKSVERIPLE